MKKIITILLTCICISASAQYATTTALKDSVAKIRNEYKTALKDTAAKIRAEYKAAIAPLLTRLTTLENKKIVVKKPLRIYKGNDSDTLDLFTDSLLLQVKNIDGLEKRLGVIEFTVIKSIDLEQRITITEKEIAALKEALAKIPTKAVSTSTTTTTTILE